MRGISTLPRIFTEDIPKVVDVCGVEKSSIDLDYSRQLDVHVWSDYPEVNDFVNRIYDQYIYGSNYDVSKWHDKKKATLKVLLLSMYVNWLDDPDLLTGFSRTLAHYKAGSRYNKLHISRLIIEIQETLSEAGLINWVKGWKDPDTGIRRNTKLWPTESLAKEFEAAQINRLDLRLQIQSYNDLPRVGNRELIVMHEKIEDEYGRDQQISVEYNDTPTTHSMRDVLCAYNAVLSHHHIDLCNTDKTYVWHHGDQSTTERLLDPATGKAKYNDTSDGGRRSKRVFINQDNFVYRVFNNNSWKQGGRFYGGFWQRIPRQYRKYIRIDGQPTVEVDYSSHHPVLLYARKGINYWKECGSDNDPYDLREEFASINDDRYPYGGAVNLTGHNEQARLPEVERTLIKVLMLVLVNTKSEETALKGTRQKIRELAGDSYSHDYKSLTNARLKKYIKAIRMKHKPIASYLGHSGGMELQYLDSQITEEIVHYFSMRGIPILCVHDSYIIWKEYLQDLRFQMNKQWIKFSGLKESEVTEIWESEYVARFPDGSSKTYESKRPMPTFIPTKEIQPLTKRKQYVSERHKADLKNFQDWRRTPERIEIMKAIGLFDSGTVEVWLKYARELKAGKIFKQMVDATIERNNNKE